MPDEKDDFLKITRQHCDCTKNRYFAILWTFISLEIFQTSNTNRVRFVDYSRVYHRYSYRCCYNNIIPVHIVIFVLLPPLSFFPKRPAFLLFRRLPRDYNASAKKRGFFFFPTVTDGYAKSTITFVQDTII